jgi:hypothetical protein
MGMRSMRGVCQASIWQRFSTSSMDKRQGHHVKRKITDRNSAGFDQYHPLSKEGRQMESDSKGMGWIIVDALDTLMIMNLTSRLSHAREWMSTSLDYNQDHEVNTFETTIRMLGGLLSAHYLSTEFPDMAPLTDDDHGAPGEDLYLEKAADLADRIMGAFESDSGVPYASINLKTSQGKGSHVDGGASSTAEAASLQLEFKYLAMLTGEKNYWEKAEKVIQVIDDNGMEDGLLPIFIYATTGTFRGDYVRLGSRGDSYYEYLIKQYLQTAGEEPIYQDLWNQSLAGVRKHLITYSAPHHFTVLGERPDGLGGKIFGKMDHLVCFMPGTIALGVTGGLTIEEAKKAGKWDEKAKDEMELAKELTKTCWGMYKMMATGLAPEIAHFRLDETPHMEADGILASAPLSDDRNAKWKEDYVVKSNDQHNLQRPETVESLFYMWRITGNEMYREWGWEMFKSFVKYTAADDGAGFTSLSKANEIPPLLRDNMESFWLVRTCTPQANHHCPTSPLTKPTRPKPSNTSTSSSPPPPSSPSTPSSSTPKPTSSPASNSPAASRRAGSGNPETRRGNSFSLPRATSKRSGCSSSSRNSSESNPRLRRCGR